MLIYIYVMLGITSIITESSYLLLEYRERKSNDILTRSVYILEINSCPDVPKTTHTYIHINSMASR